ncbi:MAG: saccharopine dehydrogenase NADP-binding domain-containing protein [Pseudomonadota bacterium]
MSDEGARAPTLAAANAVSSLPTPESPLRVLLLGGYGRFGFRLVRLLRDEPSAHILVAGRSAAKAKHRLATLGETRATLEPLALNRDTLDAARLAALRPDLVIDASGPFQSYGDAPYRIPEAAIEAGADYLDIADGTAFVTGITALDRAAQDASVFVRSGVSTVPALSFAATRALAAPMDEVHTLQSGIAPSPKAVMGPNVLRAILSYAGRRLDLPQARGGQGRRPVALVDARRMAIEVDRPGKLPMLTFYLVDVPDYPLLQQTYPHLRDLWFGAATRPQAVLHGLAGGSWLVSKGWLPRLTPLAGLMDRASAFLRFGLDRGGMVIMVTGRARASGDVITRRFDLTADGTSGPQIPSLACAAVVRRRLKGQRLSPGAAPAHEDFTLEEFAPLFEALEIGWQIRDVT